MKAREVMEHFRAVGRWVNWNKTCDQFLHGDPDIEVKGIATAWIPTNAALREAAACGLNLFITHEPAFCGGYEGTVSGDKVASAKRKLLDKLGITLMRCHDTWDRMPDVGIPDAWATFLGFETEQRSVKSFYKICLLGDMTVEEAGRAVLKKVRRLGQGIVLIVGDREKRVSRMAVGTGAITNLPKMLKLKPDVILATDDGINFWDGGLWAVDLGLPLLIVNHSTAEKPGMQAMARYLSERYQDLPIQYVDVVFPYGWV
jgi:putative NIF3 family GTP cyclohydrolase 1 type 2